MRRGAHHAPPSCPAERRCCLHISTAGRLQLNGLTRLIERVEEVYQIAFAGHGAVLGRRHLSAPAPQWGGLAQICD
ncbi:MAG: hypothetical protein ACPIOQ_72120, partial [Promethearchaeia archaeon]